MKRVYNCIESHDQHRDWSLQKAKILGLSARKKAVPASKDLREPWWNVGDQADTGSCVGWALADSVLRYHFVKAGKLRKHELNSVRYIWMAATASPSSATPRPISSFVTAGGRAGGTTDSPTPATPIPLTPSTKPTAS